jgi:hypothetical protein
MARRRRGAGSSLCLGIASSWLRSARRAEKRTLRNVGELGDILELLQGAEPRWQTLQAIGRNWRHQPRANEVFERHFAAIEAGRAPGSVVRLTAGYVPKGPQPPVPDESEDQWRLWMEQGGRTRSESSVGDRSSIVVFDGPTWWSWSTDMGGMTNHGADNHQHGFGPAEGLLDTAALLSALRLESLGRGVVLGRDVVRLRGLPRISADRRPDHGLHALGVGADDYLLSVDAATGVVLSAAARLREQPFIVIEMTEVAFDIDMPPQTFTMELPPGETFEDVSQRGSRHWSPRPHRFARVFQRKGPLRRRG